MEEIGEYKIKGYFREVPQNLKEYFNRKSSIGCILVEKENGPDHFIEDVREDVFKRFMQLREIL